MLDKVENESLKEFAKRNGFEGDIIANEKQLLWGMEFEKALADLNVGPISAAYWVRAKALYEAGLSAQVAAPCINWEEKFKKALQGCDLGPPPPPKLVDWVAERPLDADGLILKDAAEKIYHPEENDRRLIWEAKFEKSLRILHEHRTGFIDWVWARLLYAEGLSAHGAAEKIYYSTRSPYAAQTLKQLGPEENKKKLIWDAKFEKALLRLNPTPLSEDCLEAGTLFYAKGMSVKEAAKTAVDYAFRPPAQKPKMTVGAFLRLPLILLAIYVVIKVVYSLS